MPTTCKKGEIWRSGYVRKASKKTSKKIPIRGKCIKATSQTGEKTSVLSRQYLKERKDVQELAREKFGVPKCKKGEIIREGYRRGSKSGKQVWVPPTCIESKGKVKGFKQERLFYIEPGRLSKYGYDELFAKSDAERHTALRKAFAAGEKPLSISRRLNALAIVTKNTNPKLSQKFKEDSEWVKFTDEYVQERLKR